jgi:hypothetical protein
MLQMNGSILNQFINTNIVSYNKVNKFYNKNIFYCYGSHNKNILLGI